MSNDCTGGPDRCDRQVRMDEQSPGHRGSHTMQRASAQKSSRPSQQRGAKQNSNRSAGKSKPSKSTNQGKQASAAAAYATKQTGQHATVVAGRDSCRVVHREFIGNVTGSASFAIDSTFAVNPGLQATFPWLSGIAKNWETYRFRKLRFCYYTRTGTSVPGSVILAHDPDSSDAAPASEQIMTTYESCAEDAPWKDIHMPIKSLGLNDIGPRKFVRAGGLNANEDIKLYDSGNFFVGVVDGTAVNWGKLWVEYDVDLYTPQLQAAGAAGGGLVSGVAGTTASPLGAAPSVDAQAVGFTVNASSVMTLTLAGTYLMVVTAGGTTVTDIPTPTAGAGVAITALGSVLINGAATSAQRAYIVVVSNAGSTATLAFSMTAAAWGSFSVRLGAAPANSLA